MWDDEEEEKEGEEEEMVRETKVQTQEERG